MVACKALNTLVALTSLTLSLQILQLPPPFQTHKPPDHSLRFPGTFSFVLAFLSASVSVRILEESDYGNWGRVAIWNGLP